MCLSCSAPSTLAALHGVRTEVVRQRKHEALMLYPLLQYVSTIRNRFLLLAAGLVG